MRTRIRKIWGKIRIIDRNFRKNEESGTLAHPGLRLATPLKICILRAEILAKTRLKMQNFSKNWKWGHMSGALFGRLGSTDWPEKRGSWLQHIPILLSNVSAPPAQEQPCTYPLALKTESKCHGLVIYTHFIS